MTALVRYEAARTALAEAHRVDEVKDIRDKAEAMAAYARQAKDSELIQYATEIKVRAERRCGELLQIAAANGERHHRGRAVAEEKPTTLQHLGITANQSSRWQSLASMTPEHFETAVETAKATAGEVTTAFMLREAAKHKPAGKPKTGKQAEAIRQELREAKSRGVSMLCTYGRLLLQAIRATDQFTDEERELLSEIAGAIAHPQGD